MEDVPVLVDGAPVKSRLLKEFTGSSVGGVSVSLTDEEMAIISAHLVSFVIFDVNLDAAPLRTPWNHVSFTLRIWIDSLTLFSLKSKFMLHHVHA